MLSGNILGSLGPFQGAHGIKITAMIVLKKMASVALILL
jgi:hypothetical protein